MSRVFRLVTALAASWCLSGCIKEVRVPLPTPLPTVGGARPIVGEGLQFLGEFGDGVWGQEQERAEMAGVGLGVSAKRRFEALYSAFHSTRKVRVESSGTKQSGSFAHLLRGKLNVGEFQNSRLWVGLHLSRTWAARNRGTVQDEELRALDLAIPVEFRWLAREADPRGVTAREIALYAGPRTVIQNIRDRATRERDRGAILAILLGAKARLGSVGLIGELNFAWTPAMELGSIRSDPGFIVLPMIGIRVLVPTGEYQ
jgi:hypothetical protein